MPLPPPLPAERRDLGGRAGPMALWSAGRGAPMLMIHSINAAASAYEVRPAFERFARTHRVHAPDLPGFGSSDRSPRRYDAELYVAAIDDALDAIADEAGDVAVDVLALSLSSEFAARAAGARPDRVRSLTLVTPTGLDARSQRRAGGGAGTLEVPGLGRALAFPAVGGPLFTLLTSAPSVRFFLRRTWGSPDPDPGLTAYCVASAREPGARYAPLAFVSGRLFARDPRALYKPLRCPVWVPHGTRGDFTDFSGAGWTRALTNWRLQAFDTGAFPHFEQPDAFEAAYRERLNAA
jgi:pimeloyl-ACP methyl ester carboxylesterase